MSDQTDAALPEDVGNPPSIALTVEPTGSEESSLLPDRRLDEGLDESEEQGLRLPNEDDLPANTTVPVFSTEEERKIRGRILLMESDVEVANTIVDVLEEAQYELELAMDAKFGLILADTFDPEIILIDVRLPGLSGTDLKQILRSAPNFSGRFVDIPILYMGDQEFIVKQRFSTSPETPMARYLMKPIDPQELRDKVARAFAELQQRLAAQEN